MDAAGNLYVADAGNNRIRRIDSSTQVIETVVGTGEAFVEEQVSVALESDLTPHGLAVDAAGKLYVADSALMRVSATRQAVLIPVALGSSGESVTLEVSENGAITWLDGRPALAGDVSAASNGSEYALGTGTDGRITATYLPVTQAVELAYGGSVELARDEDATWRIDGEAVMHGDRHESGGNEYVLESIEGIWGLVALQDVLSIPLQADGEFDLPDGFEFETRFSFAQLAGGYAAMVGQASLFYPQGLAADAAGNVYVADASQHVVLRVNAANGAMEIFAGTGDEAYGGDGGPASEAHLDQPHGLAVDAAGNVYVADWGNHRVRKIDVSTGLIETVAGDGMSSYSGDGGPATAASLAYPRGVAVDSAGNVFVADSGNHRIRRIDAATGDIDTIAGTGERGFGGDGGPASEAVFDGINGLAVDAEGNVYVADGSNHRIRKIDGETGNIETVAGNGELGFEGNGGPADEAQLGEPYFVAVDALGNFYVSHYGPLRRIDAATEVIEALVETVEGEYVWQGDPVVSPRISVGGLAFDAEGQLLASTEREPGFVIALQLAAELLILTAGTREQRIEFELSEDGLLRHRGRLVTDGSRVVTNGRRYTLERAAEGILASYLPWDPCPEVPLLDPEWMASADAAAVTGLLDGGCSVWAMDRDGRTPLHFAAWRNSDPTVAGALLDRGATSGLWAFDAEGRTPLHYAALHNASPAVAELLLDRGADPFLFDNEGRAAMDLATRNGNSAVAELVAERAENLVIPNPHQVATWRLVLGDWARSATIASITAVLDADSSALATSLRGFGGLLQRIAAENPDPAVVELLVNRSGDEVDIDSLLLAAALNRNPAVMRLVLGLEAEIAQPVIQNALNRALWSNSNPAVPELLLDRGAEADARVLRSAAANRNPAVIELLLDRAAEADAPEVLQMAARNLNPAVAELLLDRGADVNAADWIGNTALHVAVTNLNPSVARLLLNRGADIHAVNRRSETPLSVDRYSSTTNPTVVQLLIDAGAGLAEDAWWSLRTPTVYGTDLSQSWLRYGSVTQVEQWLEQWSTGLRSRDLSLLNTSNWGRVGRGALHWAALNPNPAVAELLLDQGAEYRVPTNSQGERLVDIATALDVAIQSNPNPGVLALLIERGAEFQSTGLEGKTPLQLAARYNPNPSIAELLIDLGADVHATTVSETTTALHQAARYNLNPAVAGLLVNRGADLAARDAADATPLLRAWANRWRSASMAGALIALGAEHSALTEKRLLDATWLAEATDSQLEAQVINASDEDFLEKDACGRMPLHLLTYYTAKGLGTAGGEFRDSWQLFFLRNSNTYFEGLDSNGNTAFHYAVAGVNSFRGPHPSQEQFLNNLIWAAQIKPDVVGGGSLQAAHYSSPLGNGDFSSFETDYDGELARLMLRNQWGDFRIDPMTGEQFPNLQVPTSRFDTCVVGLP